MHAANDTSQTALDVEVQHLSISPTVSVDPTPFLPPSPIGDCPVASGADFPSLALSAVTARGPEPARGDSRMSSRQAEPQ